MSNDPERQVNQLLQCLTQDKMRIGFLFGAGGPYSIKIKSNTPLIPNIKGLTEIVKKEVCCEDCEDPWENICSQIIEDGNSQPNIEDILSRVRSLKDLAGSSDVKGLNKTSLEEIETRICEEIIKCVSKDLPSKNTPFHNFASWVASIDRSNPVEVFTTNYDLLIEQAFEDLRVPFFDGFVGSRQPFFDSHAVEFNNLPPRWARLWKIHGSINWRSFVDDGFKVCRTDSNKGGSVVIHPSHLKYEQSRKMPYLAMMDQLRKFLSTPSSAMIIVGYSFGDQHLNDVIIQSLQGTPSTAVFALMYGPLKNYSNAVTLAKERGNLSILAKDGTVTGTREQIWRELDEQPDSLLPSGTIEWKKGAKEDDPWKASLKLGDFNKFGAFLQDITGKKV